MTKFRNLISIIISLSYSLISIAQSDVTIIRGVYSGKDMKWQQGFVLSGIGFCLTEIKITNITAKRNYSTVENPIELATYARVNDSLKIEFIHQKGCTVKIINPDILLASCKSIVNNLKIENGYMTWNTTSKCISPVIIKQFKWGKWVELGQLADTVNSFDLSNYLHEGKNKFRLCQIVVKSEEFLSDAIIYNSGLPAIVCKTKIIDHLIEFDRKTSYELFDSHGNFIQKGFSDKIDCSNFLPGEYYINYDNTQGVLKKK